MLRSTENARKKKNCIPWVDLLYFDGGDRTASLVSVCKKTHIPFKRDKVVASLTDTIGGILAKSNNDVLEVPLGGGTSDPPECSGITIKFTLVVEALGDVDTNELQATDAVNRATEAISALRPAPQIVGQVNSAIGAGTQVATEAQTFETTWNVLLKRMALFNKIVAAIAELHPYTSLAWSAILSAANQVLVNQQARDDRVIRNPTTGQCIAGPFQGHTEEVGSIAYSPDGSHIVSGSGSFQGHKANDLSIRAWTVLGLGTTFIFPFIL